MKRLLHRLDTEGKKAGLLLNVKKTEVMHLNSSEMCKTYRKTIPTLNM